MKNIFVILCSAAMLLSCVDKHETTPAVPITLSAQALAFNTAGVAIDGNTITVTCAGDWRLTDNSDWVTPSATRGQSGQSVSFDAQPNDTEDIRRATYTFMCGGQVAQVVVTQGPADELEYTTGTADFTITQGGGYITTGLRSNVELQYEIDPDCADWILPDRGTSRSTPVEYVQFRVLENSDAPYQGRTGKVTLFPGTENERVLNVTQKQRDAVVILCPELVNGTYSGTTEEGEVTISVDANIDYQIAIADKAKTWLTSSEIDADGQSEETGLVRRTYKFTYAEAAGSRSGKVTFSATGFTDAIQIVQKSANPVLGTFPDANFRNYLINNGYIGEPTDEQNTCEVYDDGMKLTTLTAPYSSSAPIASVEGVGCFTELTTLTVSNLKITALDLSGNTKLTTLTANGCSVLESVDLSQNTELVSVSITSSKVLKKVDVHGKRKLTKLLINTGVIEEVDLRDCPMLTDLNVSANCLQRLDVSQCGALTNTNFGQAKYINNPFSEIVLGEQNVTTIYLADCHFKANMATDTGLLPTSFTISGSKITSLDITIGTSNKKYDVLEWIDITGAPSITTLKCKRGSLLCTAIYIATGQTQPKTTTKDTKTLFVVR